MAASQLNSTLVRLAPIEDGGLKDRIYDSLKRAILEIDVYADAHSHRLDERQLAERLGVSRTPLREALARLEHEGLVRMVPRRGTFVARKSKTEIVEIITAWAALESMAARLATTRASDEEIAALKTLFARFEGAQIGARIDEYSQTNIRFHQAILALGKCALIEQMTDNLLLHMRSIRKHTIAEKDRVNRSIIDHMHIIEAIEARDPDTAERLVRQHSLDLAAHVEAHVDWLE
ncbi:MAG: GntR family transcriptional regulator, partial [Gammaproteobacteria bacterium]|nr:GntR family transcriptional regulator [Gammaproteobacteria bacterium]